MSSRQIAAGIFLSLQVRYPENLQRLRRIGLPPTILDDIVRNREKESKAHSAKVKWLIENERKDMEL